MFFSLEEIVSREIYGFLTIFSKKNNFQEKTYNSSLSLIKNNVNFNKNLLTYKDFTIIYSTKKDVYKIIL